MKKNSMIGLVVFLGMAAIVSDERAGANGFWAIRATVPESLGGIGPLAQGAADALSGKGGSKPQGMKSAPLDRARRLALYRIDPSRIDLKQYVPTNSDKP